MFIKVLEKKKIVGEFTISKSLSSVARNLQKG